jgi:hypothetical protein
VQGTVCNVAISIVDVARGVGVFLWRVCCFIRYSLVEIF